jgi:CBS domain-containing protein
VIGAAPLFPVPGHAALAAPQIAGSLVVGLVGGLLAWALTAAVYGAEDAFAHLPIHWMWWPAIGGLVVGVGGLVEPRALGVGYESIRAELAGELAFGALLALLVVKLVIWAVALGSGTSGGILAPLLILGGAAGAVVGQWLPPAGPGVWAMLGMAAALAGVTRSPLTALVFAVELTHDQDALLPLLVSCMTAYAISVLALRRSILTEKVARRGYHVTREYAVDPLEALLVRDVMSTNVLTAEPDRAVDELDLLAHDGRHRRQRLYPVVAGDGSLLGVVARRDLDAAIHAPAEGDQETVASLMRSPVVAYPDETLRVAAERMARSRLRVLPVVDRAGSRRLLGLVSDFELLRARDRLLVEERHRERVIRLRRLPSLRRHAGEH